MKSKDWKEQGIKPKLGSKWILLMNELNKAAIAAFGSIKVINEDNMILIDEWKIYANFINNEYIEMVIERDGIEIIQARLFEKQEKTLAIIMMLIIKSY